MGMHAAPVMPEDGFGHERGIHTMLARYLLDHHAVCLRFVSHPETFIIPQIDLVLARGNLVMAILHIDPHGL